MIQSVLKKLFGSANERVIKKYKKRVQEISLIEPQLVGLSDEELSLRTPWLKSRLENGETLDDILVDAFATVREAAKRVFSQRHYDVQLIGGMVLHDGKIAEMRTGEGKTLVATLPVYLNALLGKGVHLVTINDYLAKRDSEWMGRVYRFLGLSVGCIVHGLTDRQRQENYSCDVTYGTNHEFGFDYLRDNMKFRLSDMVQRPFNYAIVDEVDSILVDEARTPLIISGSAEDSSELYQKINEFIPLLTDEDVEKDEKQKNVMLTEQGVEKIESLVIQAGLLKGESLYDVQNVSIVHHVNCALKAHKMFTRDVDYMVKDDKVMIIDEFTGRIMEGRRYSEGLHQALEAKEHVKIENENQTLASITYQNFFRLYPKLSGMTGTGATEATEFDEIYKLQVVEIPTNVPVQRIDHDDEVYLTEKDKFAAMIKEIKAAYEKKQPVLVGTASIEKSEVVSKLLTKEGIKHQVLNAKYHEQESYIVALAGRLGGITVATNMAGRGTDIKLGGNAELQIELELKDIPEGEERLKKEAEIKAQVVKDEQTVKELGGLYVIGTERHESRRIDNQLRGRSGRQGDPGVSKFFISLQDDLMRIFGSERLDSMLRRFGVQEGEVISHKMISKSLARAQQKVEARNFDIRKHLLKYDDVMNDQRKIIYEQRRFVMECDTLSPMMNDMREDVIDRLISIHIPTNSLIDEWDMQGLHMEAKRIFNLDLPFGDWVKEDTISEHAIKDRLLQATQEEALKKKQDFGEEMMASAEKTLLLRLLDQSWKDHLLTLDHLRQGINLRAYAQSNPLNEYKREAFALFQEMMERLKENVIASLSHFQIQVPDMSIFDRMLDEEFIEGEEVEDDFPTLSDEAHAVTDLDVVGQEKPKRTREKKLSPDSDEIDPNDPSTWARLNRNALCPCGSGKRYKQCHGAF